MLFREALEARPLLVAGAAGCSGALCGAHALPPGPGPPGFGAGVSVAALLGAVALLVAVAARSPAALAAAAALAAGFAAATAGAVRSERALVAGDAWPAGDARNHWAPVHVDVAAEDPFGDRAWVRGRTPAGMGLLCVWKGPLPDGVERGAVVEVHGRFFAPRPPGNPGERDRRRELAADGISLVADLRTPRNVTVVRPARAGWHRFCTRLRRRAARRLRDTLPPDVAPLAAAVALGVRGGLTDRDRLLFERTGTLHLLAISGMHVLLLAGLLHALLRRAGVGPRAAAAATLALAVCYVPLAGAGPPIRRAVAMLAFYALALVRGRPPDAGSALGGAALAIALSDPGDVGRVGFRLSFAAAGGIALCAARWHERWSRRHRLLARFPAVRADRPLRLIVARYLLGAAPVALAAWWATQGLVAHSFGIVTPWSPIVNVAIGPLVALLVPLAALAAAGAGWAAVPLAATARGLRRGLAAAGELPGSFLVVAPASLLAVTLWGASFLIAARRLRYGFPALLLAASALARPPPATPTQLLLLDVGHGQAALVRFAGGGTVLIDAGSRSRLRLARRTLLPALRALGVRRLDTIICTHRDADHWNALPDLFGTLPVGRLCLGRAWARSRDSRALRDAARRHGIPVVGIGPGSVLHSDATTELHVLAGGVGVHRGANDDSLALLLSADGRHALLPADREEAGLDALLSVRGVGRCEVLVAPHHGGHCASAPEFGRRIAPRELIVSTGTGFADSGTLTAYGASRIWRTDRDGCVVVEFLRDEIRVRGLRR